MSPGAVRVLIVDDSETSRTLLRETLGADRGIDVVGEAVDGAQAVEMTRRLRPDVVTMDLTMPVLDGFAATREIMTETPTPIVVVTASSVASEADTAMRSLAAGALAVMPKLPAPTSAGFAREARDLVSTVKAMSQVKVVRRHRRAERGAAAAVAPASRRAQIVAIGASTGGPQALQEVLSHLPADFPMPIVVVQHITRGFGPGFAKWLGTTCALAVREAIDGEPLSPRTVYLAPDDRHLGISRSRRIELSSAPPIGGFRPSATHLFRSVGEVYGAAALAVILTGMGRDGVEGLRTVHERKGQVIAQDERTSVVFGMPGEAVAAGVVDRILPMEEIAGMLLRCAAATTSPRTEPAR